MPILFAKINPAAEIPEMTSPFQYNIKNANYIAASASPYRLGSTEVIFTVVYGIPTFDADGNMETFENLLNSRIPLSGSALENWGTDDSVVLAKLCETLGTQAVEYVEGSPKNFHFP